MSTQYNRTNAKKGVLHHLGDGKPAATTADELRRRANPYGYEYPEYDFGILADGTVISMRPLTVIGAHTQADYSKYLYGENWWNKNALGIVLGIDCTKFAPPASMVQGLIKFLLQMNKERGMTMDDWYPHFQLSRTACPGAKYKKLGLDTGYLDYDYVEQSVNNGGVQMQPTPQPKPEPTPELSPDLSIEYRTHVQNQGWGPWVRDGEISGTTGQSLRVEAIQMRIVKK